MSRINVFNVFDTQDTPLPSIGFAPAWERYLHAGAESAGTMNKGIMFESLRPKSRFFLFLYVLLLSLSFQYLCLLLVIHDFFSIE